LRWNEQLAAAALVHAEVMARGNYFSHTGRDGSNPAQRVERAGYRYRSIGENIAGGQMQPEAAVAGWIKSPPHCQNLMNGVHGNGRRLRGQCEKRDGRVLGAGVRHAALNCFTA